jgi:integrase
MPRLTNATPSYREHRPSGQAVVTLDGRDHYCGPHGTRPSRAEYDRLIGEWLANGRRPLTTAGDLTVAELVAQFWDHAKAYYRHPDGTATSEQSAYKLAVGVLVRLYGRTPAANFGPLSLEAVRQAMITNGWARGPINIHVGRIKRLFRLAVSRELVPATVHHALVTVAGLRAGRSEARESEAVQPVPDATVEQTSPHLSPTVAAMVRLQLLTGARPGEICLGQSDGPRVQPGRGRGGPPPTSARRPDHPGHHGNRPGTDRVVRPRKVPGDRYDLGSYRRAIASACRRAFPPPSPLARENGETTADHIGRLTDAQRAELSAWNRRHSWHTHQLRHTAATAIRRRFGFEAAQHVLGHATLSVTEICAERNAEAARAVAAAIG